MVFTWSRFALAFFLHVTIRSNGPIAGLLVAALGLFPSAAKAQEGPNYLQAQSAECVDQAAADDGIHLGAHLANALLGDGFEVGAGYEFSSNDATGKSFRLHFVGIDVGTVLFQRGDFNAAELKTSAWYAGVAPFALGSWLIPGLDDPKSDFRFVLFQPFIHYEHGSATAVFQGEDQDLGSYSGFVYGARSWFHYMIGSGGGGLRIGLEAAHFPASDVLGNGWRLQIFAGLSGSFTNF